MDAGVATSDVHYVDVPQQFSGNVFYTTIDGAFVCGYIYDKGKVTKARSGQGSITRPTLQVQTVLAPGECETIRTAWYEQTCRYTSSNELIDCTNWEYLFTTVDVYCNIQPSGGGGGGGGTVPPPLGCIPSGSGQAGGPAIESVNPRLKVLQYEFGEDPSEPPPPCEPVKIIVNDIKDPCLKKMVDSAINRNINYNLTESMNGIFNSNTKFNIKYVDALMDPKDDGATDIDYMHNGAPSSTGRTVPDALDLTITLNKTLSNSSQEFITSTILHEALHAYFLSSWSSSGLDHDYMVMNYMPWFKKILHSLYPNVPDDELSALGYGGLMENPSFDLGSQAIWKDRYKSIYDKYKSGDKGRKCI